MVTFILKTIGSKGAGTIERREALAMGCPAFRLTLERTMPTFNWHVISTHAWIVVIALITGIALGAAGGFSFGFKSSPSYQDALRVEQRLREVFCDQAIRNGLLKTCEVFHIGSRP